MDHSRFEDLSRRVAEAGSRRAAMTALAGAVVAPLLAGLRAEEAEAGLPIVHCKTPGKRCNKDKKCCSCVKKRRPCWAPLEGALCCSQRCKNGKCA